MYCITALVATTAARAAFAHCDSTEPSDPSTVETYIPFHKPPPNLQPAILIITDGLAVQSPHGLQPDQAHPLRAPSLLHLLAVLALLGPLEYALLLKIYIRRVEGGAVRAVHGHAAPVAVALLLVERRQVTRRDGLLRCRGDGAAERGLRHPGLLQHGR